MLDADLRLGLEVMDVHDITVFVVAMDVVACFLQISTITLVSMDHDDQTLKGRLPNEG
jgi:hypothetical protein